MERSSPVLEDRRFLLLPLACTQQLVKAKKSMLAHLTESPGVFLASSVAGHRDSDVTGLVSVSLSISGLYCASSEWT